MNCFLAAGYELPNNISESTKDLLAQLIHTNQPFFIVDIANVNRQSGAKDCGLFAIAYVTSLAFQQNPSLCVFEQNKMRQHLKMCFEKGKLVPFPVIK